MKLRAACIGVAAFLSACAADDGGPAASDAVVQSTTRSAVQTTSPDEYANQVRSQISDATDLMRDRGFSLAFEPYYGALDEGEAAAVTATMRSGTQYLFTGFCDNDCADLDLILFDASDTEITRDEETDSYPVVAVTPPRSGTYRLVVEMYDCSIEPCRFGAAMYKR